MRHIPEPEVPRLVPIEDAQRELGGISRTKLWELANEGYLVRARIGRRAFITGDSIANYIDSISYRVPTTRLRLRD